ncbi:MAG: MgtC/SapB family protein [Paenibacillus macerans]|uniref:Protein SapB n=2 Tax=Paenibacillus macerans TaxID=44252 RepID=A0A090ZFJ3_PAEMA|nr:MgtC/SapB family protein [Paenibacillus macerans]KFN09000.1 protein SapB [Paenibacillus macerans]MCY7560823.1 MgtC/SapB family protein [Paenibacillus macerans]MDU5949707.1 MgtC/SapB family protein [Paenibacillus macerans]MDU7476287.1 MgtC/SapB family protein [Paenibacillus macerans]MEC0139937.1 MgtC/SapB family protein [Paenibacillus macerans]
MMMEWEMAFKLCMALLFGLFIGIDRQLKQKPLGIKTSMVICIASCLVTIVSIESFAKFATPEHPNMDPMRLAAQIVSGIGFLGAGAILRRSNEGISGLTSAAMIWAASGIGIAIGIGFYLEAALTTVLLIISVNFIPYVIKWVGPYKLSQRDVSIKVVMENPGNVTELIRIIERKDEKNRRDRVNRHRIRRLKIKDLEDGRQRIDMVITASEKEYTTEIYHFLRTIEHVHSVEVENL